MTSEAKSHRSAHELGSRRKPAVRQHPDQTYTALPATLRCTGKALAVARCSRWLPRFVKVRIRQWVINPLQHHTRYVLPLKSGHSALTTLLNSTHPVATQYPLIRIGSDGDGGYLVPDDLEGITTCFSPGVGNVSRFEEDCALRGMRVFMADRSVQGPPSNNPKFDFLNKYIGLVDTDEYISLDSWIDSSVSSSDGDLILQMDIEGAEWLALANVSRRNLMRFRIIVVELHAVDSIVYSQFFELRAPVLTRLLEDFVCVHLHPNNDGKSVVSKGINIPCVLEMTLLRKDRAQISGYCSQFPHPLDSDNTLKAPMPLPLSLYRQV